MTICDKCGQQVNPPASQQAGRRICADCGKRIRKREKWFIGIDGRLHHRDCAMPTGTPVPETMDLLI
jgi:DNA-directed RNA polymerase subunit RPC12/RpoP